MTGSPSPLTPRWKQLRPHATQRALWYSMHRFCVVPAGRRSGKTELAKRKLVSQAINAHILRPEYESWYYFAAAPTRDQAKRIYWHDLKRLVPPYMVLGKPSESQLMIRLITGAEIWVLGMDKPERVEGSPWDWGILDEFGNMKPTAWSQNVRPALSDRLGGCWLIGVPEGRNHYYERALYAMSGQDPEWGYYHWKSAEILPPAEVDAARRELDELSFQQEYEGSFVNFKGRAYYTFDQAKHCAPLNYHPNQPLIFCFDFNVSPGVAVICQEQPLPGQFQMVRDGRGQEIPIPLVGTGVIGQVYVPQNSNTPIICRKLINDWGNHRGDVICYGDATGGASGTAKVEGSDWELIKKHLRPVFGERLSFRVPSSNPAERVRVNSVNSRLLSVDGIVRMMIDPVKAPMVVRDLDGVRILEGSSGELDKRSDAALTHISDALGYYIVREFPIVKREIGDLQMLNRY